MATKHKTTKKLHHAQHAAAHEEKAEKPAVKQEAAAQRRCAWCGNMMATDARQCLRCRTMV